MMLLLHVLAVCFVTSLVTALDGESDLAAPEQGDCLSIGDWSLCVSGPIVAREGSNITLPCNYTVPSDVASHERINIIWAKGRQYKIAGTTCDNHCSIYGVDKQNVNFTGRVSLVNPNATNRGDLRLAMLRATDEDVYFCRTESSDNGMTTKRGIRIYVDALPQVLNLSVSQLGGSAGGQQFICLVDGRPLPNVTWEAPLSVARPLNVSSEEGPSANVLTVPGPAPTGTYTCVASNRQGQIAASVQLQGPPLHPSVHVLWSVGAFLSLCAALGGVAACVWYRRRKAPEAGSVPLADDCQLYANVTSRAEYEDQKVRDKYMDLPARDTCEESQVTYATVSIGSSAHHAPAQYEQDDTATVYATVVRSQHL